MPELPEAEVICRQLRANLLGSTITCIHLDREDIIRSGLVNRSWYQGATILAIHRIGKCLLWTCAKPPEHRYILVELGMTGSVLFNPAAHGLSTHVHAKIMLEGCRQSCVYYWNPRRFGGIHLLTPTEWETWKPRRDGVDPLTITRHEFHQLIQASRGRIKNLLMNQRKVAGLGNIYTNELLFRAGIHPHARSCQLSPAKVDRLFTAMQTILRKAIACHGSTIRDFRRPDGSSGRYQRYHTVYQKAGAPCPHGCGSTIRRVITDRSSFYCPVCQPLE
ncbi:MAG: bifunctional DNA-formamidopyrimidine glycosylase/DNA-(apurinic or apyrimidinic site) lyase [Nitrospirae bacterium]|nr:MAG: bifunctional DNA-formamidopyrimidine glycosylase/DNA-(apurinic or apyrimidinic site) lyase [Nitrospirota bacterium]